MSAWAMSQRKTRESKRARVASSAVATTIGNLWIDLLIIMCGHILQVNQGSKSNYTISREVLVQKFYGPVTKSLSMPSPSLFVAPN